MSKAFMKEDDSSPDEPERDEVPRTEGPRYITPEGLERLKAELDRLWKVERPKVTAEVAAAAAMGDRSENAEYIYGKKRLREIDRRVHYLGKLLESVTVVQTPTTRRDKVFFGAWVTVKDEDGAEAVYRIVGQDESDVSARRISVESPLAKSLIGKSKGDTVTVQRPRGPVELTILTVRYEEG